MVLPAVTGGPVFKVVVTIIRPEAAVIKTEDVINPVRLSGDSGGFLVGR